MQRNFAAVEHLGIAVRLNHRDLTARDVYNAYAEGEFFNADPAAKQLLDALSFGPGAAMMPFLFYSVCGNYSELALAMLELVFDIEKENPQLTLAVTAQRCIYCLSSEGDFGSEEHVIPEAFGIDDIVLRGAVCRACNNKLSALDKYLVEFEPLAFFRVQYVPLTKRGKFPRAETRDFTIEKIKPRLIRFTSKTGERVLTKERLPDGKLKLSSTVTAKKPLESVLLARAIFKIALGVVAADAGGEFACDTRFDSARSFVRGVQGMPNHMIMALSDTPSPTIATEWDPQSRTVVVVHIFAITFVVNLEAVAFDIPDDASAASLLKFYLGEQRQGFVSPCARHCNHVEQTPTT